MTTPVAKPNPERVLNLLGKFLEAWNMGEEPTAQDIAEARQICFGETPAPTERVRTEPF